MTSAANDGPPSDASAGDEAERMRVLAFDLGNARYCVRSDAVATVLTVAGADGLESADDPWNAGVVTVSDDLVRVIDLHRIFEATDRAASHLTDPLLLVFAETDDDGAHYGWLVDDVDVTRTVRADDLEPTRARTRFVAGRLEFDGDAEETEDAVLLDEQAIHGA